MFRHCFTFFFTFFFGFAITFINNGNGWSTATGQTTSTLSLSTYDTVVCPNDSVLIEVYISGHLPIKIEYQAIINGQLQQFSKEENKLPLNIYIKSAAEYTVTRYFNKRDTVDTAINFTVKETIPPNAYLTGGGQFCSIEDLQAIHVMFSGTAPWTLTYQNNFGNVITDVFYMNDVVLLSQPGAINIRTVKDIHCQTSFFDTARIELHELPEVNITGTKELCRFASAMYSTTYKKNYKYLWSVPSGVTANSNIDATANSLSLIWTKPGNYELELMVQTINTGCTSETFYFPVKVYDFPEVLTEYDTVLCFEKETSLRINPVSNIANTIFWPHLGDSIPEIEIFEPGTYEYVETIPFGCEATGNFRVIDKCIPDIFVADAFTPNGDGINDLLEIKGVFYNLHLTIYNSNGELVYYQTPAMPDWNGMLKGNRLPNGTYYWKAKFTDKFGEPYSDEGWTTIIR